MHPLAVLDHRYVWHPFTQMRDWLRREPIVIVRGKGAELVDANGGKYVHANSSIWTNLHGHAHPALNRAITSQLQKIAHSSALGFANEPASLLGEALVRVANPEPFTPNRAKRSRNASNNSPASGPQLTKVFFSDDGSTAMEVSLKLAFEYARRSGLAKTPRFVSLRGAYHGDTVGAVSLGHIDLFHKAYGPLLFKSDSVEAPYCYRCRFNKAKPQRADARTYRQCHWECLGQLERKFASKRRNGDPYAGFVFEPLMQGAAGMIAQPEGWLSRAASIARGHEALLIADEVMTGFGRTGVGPGERENGEFTKRTEAAAPGLFACHKARVQPDFMAVAKGLTGGYLPMAATLTTQAVFDAFLGEYHEFKTFFHGHSFTGNQLGSAAALASLKLLGQPVNVRARRNLEQRFTDCLAELWRHPQVGDIRQVGLMAGVELVQDWRTRRPFDLRAQAGIRICERMARLGVLTRPIGSVLVLMPPYCTTTSQLHRMVAAVGQSIEEEFGSASARGRRPTGARRSD